MTLSVRQSPTLLWEPRNKRRSIFVTLEKDCLWWHCAGLCTSTDSSHGISIHKPNIKEEEENEKLNGFFSEIVSDVWIPTSWLFAC